MPWTLKDVARHNKKLITAKQKRAWVAIANSVLARTGDEGKAIRIANGKVAKIHEVFEVPYGKSFSVSPICGSGSYNARLFEMSVNRVWELAKKYGSVSAEHVGKTNKWVIEFKDHEHAVEFLELVCELTEVKTAEAGLEGDSTVIIELQELNPREALESLNKLTEDLMEWSPTTRKPLSPRTGFIVINAEDPDEVLKKDLKTTGKLPDAGVVRTAQQADVLAKRASTARKQPYSVFPYNSQDFRWDPRSGSWKYRER